MFLSVSFVSLLDTAFVCIASLQIFRRFLRPFGSSEILGLLFFRAQTQSLMPESLLFDTTQWLCRLGIITPTQIEYLVGIYSRGTNAFQKFQDFTAFHPEIIGVTWVSMISADNRCHYCRWNSTGWLYLPI
ncbi:hypothetical protein V8G54_030480 [Vigna mungo]|uniref:Uncharacterized protein n=1 Tax=Vigna mungo TaxID=3915 RepID=A0AAQ3MWS5_VIGMU